MGKRVVLYGRVSTEEQSKSGYSTREQMHQLDAHAKERGYDVVERLTDDGYSGADPDRPGLARVMELSEAGGIEAVVAVKRDRIFRSRLYRLLLERDLNEYGVELVALNDVGHTIGDGVLDSFSEWEREEITRRTMAGKMQKAREGKVVAGRLPVYGFRFTEDRDHYEVDEAQILAVRRLMELAAEGNNIHAIGRALDSEGFVPPSGVGRKWQRPTIRKMVFDDSYRPHTKEEMRPYLSEPVYDSLSEDLYGIWWYNRREVVKTRRGKKVREKPRSEWICVPVPDAGIEREAVDRAREALGKHEKSFSAGRREWELSQGILRCARCGAAMVAHTSTTGTRKKSGEKVRRYYYRCGTYRKRGRDEENAGCSMTRNLGAESIEERVWKAVRSVLLSPEKLESALGKLSGGAGTKRKSDPERLKKLSRWLSELQRRRDGYLELAADGIMSRAELVQKLSSVDAEIKAFTEEANSLSLSVRKEEAREQSAAAVLKNLKSHAPEALDSLSGDERRALYKDLDLRIEVDQDENIAGEKGTSYRISWLVNTDLEEERWENDVTPTR